jgi:hypothetical protein
MSDIKLLPCPFCRNKAEIEQKGDRRQSTIYQCTFCGCKLETGEEWSHGADWNTRTENKRIAELEAALRLAANRLQWHAIKQKTGTFEFIEQNEWVDEARAALEQKGDGS